MADTAGPCGCAKGADGSCAGCVRAIGALVEELVGQIAENQRRMRETVSRTAAMCQECARRDFDLGLATTLRRLAAAGAGDRDRPQVAVSVALMLADAGRRSGVESYPMTEALLKEMGMA